MCGLGKELALCMPREHLTPQALRRKNTFRLFCPTGNPDMNFGWSPKAYFRRGRTVIYTIRKLRRLKIWQVWETLTGVSKTRNLDGVDWVIGKISRRRCQSGPERKGEAVREWEEGGGEVGVSKVGRRRLEYGSLNMNRIWVDGWEGRVQAPPLFFASCRYKKMLALLEYNLLLNCS